MGNIAIIGHVDHARTTLTSAIKSVLDKETVSINLIDEQYVYEYRSNRNLSETIIQNASKSRAKKCAKGLHEFSESSVEIAHKVWNKKTWHCIHCGVLMHDRSKTINSENQ